MDKKWIMLFIIFLVSILAIGSVSAVNFSNRDFDGYFSMNVPKDVKLQKNVTINESGINEVSASYGNENLAIFYMDSFMFSESSSKYFYQTFFESINMGLTECYETQDGNLTILEPKTHNNLELSLVGTCSGNKTIILLGDDVNLLKQMGNSIKFK